MPRTSRMENRRLTECANSYLNLQMRLRNWSKNCLLVEESKYADNALTLSTCSNRKKNQQFTRKLLSKPNPGNLLPLNRRKSRQFPHRCRSRKTINCSIVIALLSVPFACSLPHLRRSLMLIVVFISTDFSPSLIDVLSGVVRNVASTFVYRH